MLQNAHVYTVSCAMVTCIFKKPKTNVFILYLLTYITYYYYQIFITAAELMYLCLNKLPSRVWKKNCPNLLYTRKKIYWKKVGIIFPFFHGRFTLWKCNEFPHSFFNDTHSEKLCFTQSSLPEWLLGCFWLFCVCV